MFEINQYYQTSEKEREEVLKMNGKLQVQVDNMITKTRMYEESANELQQHCNDQENQIKEKNLKIRALECDIVIYQALNAEFERTSGKNYSF